MTSEEELVLPIIRGPTVTEISQSHYPLDLTKPMPVEFEIEYYGKKVTIRVIVTGSDQINKGLRVFSLRVVLYSYCVDDGNKIAREKDSTIKIESYSILKNVGVIALPRHLIKRIMRGETHIE